MRPQSDTSESTAASARPTIVPIPFDDVVRKPPAPLETSENYESELDSESLEKPSTKPVVTPARHFSHKRLLGVSLLTIGLAAAIVVGLRISSSSPKDIQNTSLTAPSSKLKQQQVPINALNKQLGTVTNISDNAVTVNGSLVLTPTVQPTNPVQGQLFYSQSDNQLQFYNGKLFVNLQGSGGNSVTNNSYLSNTYVNNSFSDTSSGQLTVTGTPGTLALFGTNGSSLTNSVITQSGDTLNVGSNANTGTTNLQAGAGGILLNTEATSSSSSGNITIQSGNSTNAGAGNITIDTGNGLVSGTLLQDFTFEDGADDMAGYTGGIAECTQSSTEAHTGTYSLALTGTNGPSCRMNVGNPGIPVIAGHQYFISVWARAATVPADISIGMDWRINNDQSYSTSNPSDNSSGWIEVSALVTAPVGATEGYPIVEDDTGSLTTQYFDDLTVTDLSSLSSSELNIGTTNAQSVSIGNTNEVAPTTIAGGNGGIVINSGPNDLTESAGSFNIVGSQGSSISTSSGNLAIDSDSALTLQGGATTGGVTINTASSTNSSGDIDIQTGASSTTASGDITIDAGSGYITGTVVANYGFEDGTDDIVGWTGGAVTTQSCTVAHSDSCSLAVTGSSFWGFLQANPGVSVVAGHHYALSIWVRAGTTPEQITGAFVWNVGAFYSSYLKFPTVTDTTTGWTEISVTGIAPAGATDGVFNLGGVGGANSGGVQYFDDMTVTDLSSSTATSDINIGATNAQAVTIGNANETEATVINGGSGISLGAGVSDVDVEGGAITVTGSGASSFETTSGSLTLGSGGSTGGGVYIESQSDSTAAFNVQGAGGTTLLNVDSTDNEISLGTGAGSSIGYTSIGEYTGGDIDAGVITAQKYTTTAGGTISSMSAYLLGSSQAEQYQFAIYADNGTGSAPGAYVASSAVGTFEATTKQWYSLPITATLAPTTTYWLAFWTSDSAANASPIAANGGNVSSLGAYSNVVAWQGGADNGLPATFPAVAGTTTSIMSLYATYTGSEPALTVDQYGTMTQNGAAVFQDPTDSTQAFQIQDSLGSPLFTVDTADEIVDVSTLAIASNITIDGHIITGGTAPTYAAGPAACTVPTLSLTGDDTTGTITVTTGSGCIVSGDLATITFASAFGSNPHVLITPDNPASASLNVYNDYPNLSENSFSIGTSSIPNSSTQYRWEYEVLQ